MKFELIRWTSHILRVLSRNLDWMTWNLFLAFIPLLLSIWLFRSRQKRSPIWWAGVLVFIAFLPNAPYLLTDIIHLIHDIRANYSVWMITLVLIPQYLLVILAGFEAYVISLINLGYYLHRHERSKYILWMELTLHGLSAIGIYLGRFLRFNSWDFVTQPDAVFTSVLDDLVGKWPVVVMVVTFVIISGLYWLMKQVTLGIILRRRLKAIQSPSNQNHTDSPTA
ncbi:DUF1361 domain-containing protein [Coleofasciculus sp. FACHB-129]|uniref:DUF1361 domain-containing protein n=1 Tax=Cyanophyceae TaxID=3028117 RepID=UPI001685DB5F|nr:DUF1361 domain-containing protein [Coleofasciculus sp. FACHB-129]MBD1894223.1 DUF1361 domain-containing protein [Coleofasciculus sp. FACHB-129]